MEHKFSPKISIEIDRILKEINFWKKFFTINLDFYYDGWAIFLKEKSIYPRRIVIFKSYTTNLFSIKSFEVHLNHDKKEEFKEIYSLENIKKKNHLLKELKEIIYGKDILNNASKIFDDNFSK